MRPRDCAGLKYRLNDHAIEYHIPHSVSFAIRMESGSPSTLRERRAPHQTQPRLSNIVPLRTGGRSDPSTSNKIDVSTYVGWPGMSYLRLIVSGAAEC